jgi:heme/copper-type cytochrome/quinol oxidase subunit 3
LFSAYVLLRGGAVAWGAPDGSLSLASGLMFTALLAAAAVGVRVGTRSGLVASAALGGIFLAWKAVGYAAMVNAGMLPSTGTFLALYYLLTGVHALHVLGGVLVAGWFAFRPQPSTRVAALSLYWYFVDVVWILVFIAFYLR